MSTNQEELSLAQRLKVACVRKLRANSHKRHWRHSDLGFYSACVVDELRELRAAVKAGKTPNQVWDEAADVANFAAMIAANYEEEYRECPG